MLAEFAVKRWQFTLVLFLSLSALGYNALVSIPKAEDPTFPLPTFLVVGVLPGASPKDVERLVVDPIEIEVKALEDIKSVRSEIGDGLAVVWVEFHAGVDAERKRDEVQREVTAIRPRLPSELIRLEVTQINAANVNIVELALVAEGASFRELDLKARALKRRIESVTGVRDVHLDGLPGQEINVVLDLPRLIALGISPTEVLNAISADSANIPAGAVESGTRQFSVKTSGEYASVDEVRDTLVRSSGASAVRVRDLAEVHLVDADPAQLTRFDGQRAVLITASQQDNNDLFTVRRAIKEEVTKFERGLPAGMQLLHGFDQAENVSHRLGNFARDFGLAIVLVLVTLLPLGLRASMVVMISIPLILAIGLFLLQGTGFTLNQLSIVGFVIALGLLVDDSVVVVENIARHMREGAPPREAAIKATKQITVSVLGCTATLIFAFMPLLALPGNAGQFIRPLPVALVYTIAASLFVSLTVVPFLASVLLKREGEHGNAVFRVMTHLIEASYRPLLSRALKYPIVTLLVAAGLFAGSIALIPRIGFSLFPKAGTPQFLVHIEAEEGASLGETDRAARFVEGVLRAHPEVSRVAASVGKDHPQIFYNIAPKNQKPNVADVFAEAKVDSAKERGELYRALRKELAQYAGTKIELVEFANGPPLDAPIAMRLLGDDTEALAQAATQVEDVMRAIPGTRDVRNPSRDQRVDFKLQVDRDKAGVLGVRLPDVDRAVRLAVGGIVVGSYREDAAEEAYPIRASLPYQGSGHRPTLDALDDLYVPTAQGALPLAMVSGVELEPSPSTIRHYNRERTVSVTAHPQDGFNTDRLTTEILAKLQQTELPEGVRIVAAGEVESRKESFGGLGTAIMIAFGGILAILVLEFRTFRSTLIVASVIPLGVIGGLAALYFSGYTLSFTATVGFVALMGVEVKNSILLVDFTNELREDGLSIDAAIIRAGEVRFVPILLTTLTAIGGLVPLVLEQSALYSPLALVILGGLISSTILTRVVTPVLYKLLAPEVEPRVQHEPLTLAVAAE
ncbi:MAG TPA: efflux RND transporter permease subunit [Polyangiales bacterium]|nr:efflux RND transporter permease subunit [Polyangiales bacterium]